MSPVWLWRSKKRSAVVTTAPTSTTNMTGFFISVRGLSFTHESFSATATMPHFHKDLPPSPASFVMELEHLSGVHQQMLENRAETQRGEESERADNQDHGNQEHTKERRRHGKRARRFRDDLLAGQVARDRQHRNDHEESSEQHVETNACVVPKRVP